MMRSRHIGLSTLIFLLYGVYYISGHSSPLHNYIIVGLFLLWNFFAFVEDQMAYNYAVGSKCFGWLFLFIIYYFFTSFLVADAVYTLEYIIIYFCLYGTAIQYRYYYYRRNEKEISLIVNVFVAAFILFSLSAIAFYTINPSAARTLASDFYAFDRIAIGGGYSIAFGAGLLSVYLFELLLRRNYSDRIKPTVLLMLILLFEFLLVKTESTTTLLANVFGIIVSIIIYLYRKKGRHEVGKFLLSVFLVSVFFFVVLNINEIGEYIVDITADGTSNVLIRRFNRIGQKMMYQGANVGYTNYVDERFGTIATSWNTFLKNPVFGVGYRCGNIFSRLGENGVGTHSELVDALAQYGVIGFLPLCMYVIDAIKYQYRTLNCGGWKCALIVMLIFNPFKSFHGFLVIFFLIPMIEYIICGNSQTMEESSHG